MKKTILFSLMTVLFCQFVSAQNTCCPPFTRAEVMSNLTITYKNPSDPNSDYALTYTPSTTFNNQMTAYWNYMKLICPGKKFVIVFEVKELPSWSKAACTSWLIWEPSVMSNPLIPIRFGNPSYCHGGESTMMGQWLKCGKKYAIQMQMASEPAPNCFTGSCLVPHTFFSEKNCIISGAPAAKMGGAPGKVQISDDNGSVIKTF